MDEARVRAAGPTQALSNGAGHDSNPGGHWCGGS